MKIRQGFVSNSSSSSFIINIKESKLTQFQIDSIYDHTKYCDESDEWSVYEDNGTLMLFTIMNNFNMYGYLLSIGVNEDDIKEE